MAGESNWKLLQAARDAALAKGEEIARIYGYRTAPVDPFAIVHAEREQIHAEGDDFRDCFDGRLSFHGGRFLLLYNTKYDAWPRQSAHHPKVRFTVAHELGHFYLDRHRAFLVKRRQPLGFVTEFETDQEIERQADSFAAGLLMPKYLVAPRINCDLEITLDGIKQAAGIFDVSLTSMMVRWTQLSDFPTATLCVRGGRIQWGFVSERFRLSGLWRARRSAAVSSSDARAFIQLEPSFSHFRQDAGTGYASQWLDGDVERLSVQEFYVVIPYSQSMMVFLRADEDDLPARFEDDE